MKPALIAICGKSCSGKTTLLNAFKKSNIGATIIVSDTTRPPREGEVNGVDYNFKTDNDFILGINECNYLEWTRFRGWYYGTNEDSVCGKVNVGVFNADGIAQLYGLREQYKVIPIYLTAPFYVRLRRYIEREGKFSWECLRRMAVDAKDFYNVPLWLNLFSQHLVLNSSKKSWNLDDLPQYIVSNYLSEYYQ